MHHKWSILALLVCIQIIVLNPLMNPVLHSSTAGRRPDSPPLFRDRGSIDTWNVDHVVKKPGHYTPEDWRAAIDSVWGQGLPTMDKMIIGGRVWEEIDRRFGAFMNLNVNIDSLGALWEEEISQGVSRGRFAAFLNHFALALKDAHTFMCDMTVTWGTYPAPGVPLFVVSTARDNARFGACLTPLPDKSLLVYRALPNQRLGLEPGDIVLGYDGIPWKDLYRELLEAQLPIRLNYVFGCTDESMEHVMLQSAGLNWHLFDTIDIVKYGTGDTLHLDTSPLQYQYGTIWGNEQLPVPGVEMPDFIAEDYITWGIVDGTQIGYIYIACWYWENQYRISEQFREAVYELMFNYETEGMIIDMRLNYGGTMEEAHDGYALLFNTTERRVSFDKRGDPHDRLDMVPHPTHVAERFIIHGDPETYYDKPIAVLTGPNAVSNGDWESLRTQFHPMVRTFGKSSCGAFTPSDYPDLGYADFYMTKANGSGFLIEGHKYMAHTGVTVHEKVWLNPDDVARGADTVVEAAMAWIRGPYHLRADFQADLTTGHAPLTVTFTDESFAVPAATSWSWDFNMDGLIDSHQQHPTWIYEEPGRYTVSLQTSNDSTSDDRSREQYIRVFDGESALEFDGRTSYASCPAAPSLNLTGEFTIEAWVRPAGWGDFADFGLARIIDKRYISLQLIDSYVTFNRHSLLLQIFHSAGSVSYSNTPDSSVSLDEWQHVAVTYDGQGELAIYIDGIEQALEFTSPPSGPIRDHSGENLFIGSDTNTGNHFEGDIDEVRIWNAARTREAVAAGMNVCLTGGEPGLVANWKMNEGHGDSLTDQTVYDHTASLAAASWIQGLHFDPPSGDTDGDGFLDEEDNCPYRYNPEQGEVDPGDIDCDGEITVLDVLAVVNQILGTIPLTGAPADRADYNGDGNIDVLDAVGLIHVILGTGGH